jgi:hypothetical protein
MELENITCWRGTDGDLKPIKCICQKEFGYPHFCNTENENAEMMYSNTHFLEKKDAWRSITDSLKAILKSNGKDLENAKIEFDKQKETSCNFLIDYYKAQNNLDNPFSNEL